MIAGLIDAAGRWMASRHMLRTADAPPSRWALVLLDVQRGLYDPAAKTGLIAEVAARTSYWKNLRQLVDACRGIGMAVIHAPLATDGGPATPVHELAYWRALRQAGSVAAGSAGGELVPELRDESDVVLEPRRTVNAFYGTSLAAELARRGVSHVIIAGSVSNASVDATARTAVESDLWVAVASDCVGALNERERILSIDVTLPRMVNLVAPARDIMKLAEAPALATGVAD